MVTCTIAAGPHLPDDNLMMPPVSTMASAPAHYGLSPAPHACRLMACSAQVVDLYFMAALSKEVALIPIIAKSDCMTSEELADFKSHVVSRLMDPNVDGALPVPYAAPCSFFRSMVQLALLVFGV